MDDTSDLHAPLVGQYSDDDSRGARLSSSAPFRATEVIDAEVESPGGGGRSSSALRQDPSGSLNDVHTGGDGDWHRPVKRADSLNVSRTMPGAAAATPADPNRTYRLFFILPACLFFAMSLAVPYISSVFIYPVRDACPNWPDVAVATATSVAVATCGVTGTASGLIVGRIQPRVLGGTAAVLGALGLVGSAFVVQTCRPVWQFYLSFGFLLGILSGTGYAIGLNTVLQYFPPGFSGSYFGGMLGFGGIVFSQAIHAYLRHVSVHVGLLITAALVFALNLAWPFVKWKKPASKPPTAAAAAASAASASAAGPVAAPIGELMSHPRLYVFLISYWASLFPGWGILALFTVLIHEAAKYSTAQAGRVVGYYMILYSFSRLVSGTVSDKFFGAKRMYIGLCALQALIFVTLPLYADHSRIGLLVSLGFIMFLFGSSKVLCPGYAGMVFGVPNRVRVVGSSVMSFGMAGCLGSLTISALYNNAKHNGHEGFDRFSSFAYLSAGLTAAATLGFAFVIPRLKPLPSQASAQKSVA